MILRCVIMIHRPNSYESCTSTTKFLWKINLKIFFPKNVLINNIILRMIWCTINWRSNIIANIIFIYGCWCNYFQGGNSFFRLKIVSLHVAMWWPAVTQLKHLPMCPGDLICLRIFMNQLFINLRLSVSSGIICHILIGTYEYLICQT